MPMLVATKGSSVFFTRGCYAYRPKITSHSRDAEKFNRTSRPKLQLRRPGGDQGMRFFALAATVLCSALLCAQSTVVHSNGAFATTTAVVNNSNISLSVTRGTDSVAGDTTFLFFNIFTFNSDGTITTTAGNGFISNGDFTGGNPAHLTLNVDTSQEAGFQTTTCTIDLSTFDVTCGAGQPGLISIDWKQDGAVSIHTVSTTQETFGQFTFQSHGESSQGSAPANGTLLGIPLTSASGNAGTNHNKTMTLTKN